MPVIDSSITLQPENGSKMADQLWRCGNCGTVFDKKSEALDCESSHCKCVQSAVIRGVEWGRPDDYDGLFTGCSSILSSEDNCYHYTLHNDLRCKYPKKLYVKFVTNNKEGNTVEYVISKADGCDLMAREFREWKEEREKSKKRRR